jgi:hypothetical protein
MVPIRNALGLVCAVSFCTGIGKAQSAAKQPQMAPRQVTVSRALSWLPADTETVIGASGPFLFPDLAAIPEVPSQELSPAELEQRTQLNLPLFLFRLNNGGLREVLKGKSVRLTVEGSRHFRPPGGIGAMPYESCDIAVLDGELASQAEAFMKDAASSAKQFEKIGGVTVAAFEETAHGEFWTTFVAFPRKDVVIIATSVAYLRTVLARLSGAAGPRALPDSLPEWKYVNTRAPVWGMRHYDRSKTSADPTFPFQGQNAAILPDRQAIGLAFYFEPFDRKQAVVTYLSANEDSRRVLQGYLSMGDADAASPGEFRIRFRQPAPGAFQGSVSLSPAEALFRLLFGLTAMLGHAAYL